MAYAKQNWIDGESSVNADRMNHLEEGVADALPLAGGAMTGNLTVPDLKLTAMTYKSFSGAVIDGDKTAVTGYQVLWLKRLFGDVWHVALKGTMSYTTAVTEDFSYGINLKKIADTLGFANYGIPWGNQGSYRIFDRGNSNIEKTSAQGTFGSGFSPSSNGLRLLPGRFYSVAANGSLNYGGWPIGSLPKSSVITAEFDIRLW